MTDTACKPLADHLSARKANGLVDIKFYVHNADQATVEKACAEAAKLFEAIERGEGKPFKFDDRRAPAMVAA